MTSGNITTTTTWWAANSPYTLTGDVIVNDPGTSENVRKIFPRTNLIDAWAYKNNAVYLIYPDKAKLPKDRFGHWDSWTARRRISTSR